MCCYILISVSTAVLVRHISPSTTHGIATAIPCFCFPRSRTGAMASGGDASRQQAVGRSATPTEIHTCISRFYAGWRARTDLFERLATGPATDWSNMVTGEIDTALGAAIEALTRFEALSTAYDGQQRLMEITGGALPMGAPPYPMGGATFPTGGPAAAPTVATTVSPAVGTQ